MDSRNVDVIIIGAGLTGLTLAFYLKRAGVSVQVFEKSGRTGGVIKTVAEDGFVYETGPNSGSMGSPEMAELFEDLAEHCTLETANEDAKQRWIWKGKQWHALPASLWEGIKTPLFTWRDKFSLLAEPFRKRGNKPHESIAELVERRMGKSFLDYAVNPFICGIYAGDPQQLVTKYALPKLYQLEQNYGSFIGGSIKKGKTKDERSKKATRKVFTAVGGNQKVVDALTKMIGDENISLNAQNLQIHKTEGDEHPYQLSTTDGNVMAKAVISTCNAKALPDLFPFVDAALTGEIAQLPYAKVAQAIVGFKTWKGHSLHAFGGLVPTVEKRDTLGILFPSSIFGSRAPQGGALMTFFMGGMKRPDIVDMSDEEITALVSKELKNLLQCEATPDLIKITRYQQAIAQYDATSKERLEAIEKVEKKHKGLYLAGSIRDGIGMSDRVKQARAIADLITKP